MTAEQGKKLQPGDVVQINPRRYSGPFRECFVTITGVGPVGIQGYVHVPDVANGVKLGKAFIQLGWFQIDHVGRAIW